MLKLVKATEICDGNGLYISTIMKVKNEVVQ